MKSGNGGNRRADKESSLFKARKQCWDGDATFDALHRRFPSGQEDWQEDS
jgi:hypothetical protein